MRLTDVLAYGAMGVVAGVVLADGSISWAEYNDCPALAVDVADNFRLVWGLCGGVIGASGSYAKKYVSEVLSSYS